MKRINISLIISVITFIILIPLSYISIKKAIIDSINPVSFISPVLTVLNFFVTRYLIKHDKKIQKKKYQYDVYFSDRADEFNKIIHFLKQDYPVLYFSDKLGIGKTLLLKEAADRINGKHIAGKKYHAIYIDIGNQSNVAEVLSKAINLEENNCTIDIIAKKLKAKYKNNWVILIDGVNNQNLISVKSFSDSLYNYCSIKCIISIDDTIEQGVKLSLFDKATIRLLSIKQDIRITENEIDQILYLSKGMPVYVRFLLNQLKQDCTIDFAKNSDIHHYIYSIIENKLSDNQKKLLAIACCLNSLSNSKLNKNEVYNILRSLNSIDLDILEYYSFVQIYNNYIYIEKNISKICINYLGKYINDSYKAIANYYVHIENKKSIALLSMLKSNMDFIMDEESIKRIIQSKSNSGEYNYIIRIGDLDFSNTINPNIYDYNVYKIIQFEYFNALLELGLYNKAKAIINKYDFTKRGRTGVLAIKSELDFSIHYCLADLHHLTNDFDNAISYCDVLLQKCKTSKNDIDVKYLLAHCTRHQSINNAYAIKLFKEITESKSNLFISPKNYIRSCYSIVSIQMMEGENENNFAFSFEEIYQFAQETKLSYQAVPYIKRHEIRYIASYKKDVNKAIAEAEKELRILEKNQFRIKYDYYFELAELYRFNYEESHNESFWEQSSDYYSSAIDFARISNDFNLESTSIMGKIMLNFNKGIIEQNQLEWILSETLKKGMMINYYYACFINLAISKAKIPEELISKYKSLRFYNLYECSIKHNNSEKYVLKLIIM